MNRPPTATLTHEAAFSMLPSTDEVYASALAEHPEYADLPTDRIETIITSTLGRIAAFEAAARMPLEVSKEAAANIGTIWLHSGTGNYDEAFKAEDNPRLRLNSWMGGWDRKRMGHAVHLARKIAEINSGETIEPGSPSELPKRLQKTKNLIAEYGPTIFYSGYPAETEFAERLLDRPGMIMPRNKVNILHRELKHTPDAIRTFAYADAEAAAKEVAIVSHAPHLSARILHMLELYKPLTEGSVPYMVPVATPAGGVRNFALMETRGLLYYSLLADPALAATVPHSYQMLS